MPTLEMGLLLSGGRGKAFNGESNQAAKRSETILPAAGTNRALGVGHLGKAGEMFPKSFLGAQFQPGASCGEKPHSQPALALLPQWGRSLLGL